MGTSAPIWINIKMGGRDQGRVIEGRRDGELVRVRVSVSFFEEAGGTKGGETDD